MFVRQCYRTKNGKRHAYWALVESYRTARGPRQRVVAWLGSVDEAGRLGVKQSAEGRDGALRQQTLFADQAPRWVRVDAEAVRVESSRAASSGRRDAGRIEVSMTESGQPQAQTAIGGRQFGGLWLALQLIRRLQLDEFFTRVMPRGKERIPWANSALILIIARLCDPSSALYTAEQWYPKTALPELLGVPAARVDDNRLYRALEREVGRLLGQNTRAARLFDVTVTTIDDGRARLTSTKLTERRDGTTPSAGCYLLRSNVTDFSDEELWRASIQLTEAEAAFRIHKSDLALRPIWHQKEQRVRAHIRRWRLVPAAASFASRKRCRGLIMPAGQSSRAAWSASWPTSSGRRWPPSAAAPAWATTPAAC